MQNRRIAGIDIGTNTILMLIGEADKNGNLVVIYDAHATARLGEGVDALKIIQPAAMLRAVDILKQYKLLCGQFKVEEIYPVGTSALRDAANSGEVCEMLSAAIGAKIGIISGKDEAYLSFSGTVDDNDDSVVIDIGGGSTELVSGRNGEIFEKYSLNIGAVRLTERILKEHPPSESNIDQAVEVIKNELKKVRFKSMNFRFYAVAGTPTTLASIALGLREYQPDRVHGYILTLNKLDSLIRQLLSSDIEEIINNLHVHPKRADVITTGAIILHEAMIALKQESCEVSSHGLRYGIVKKYL